MDKTLWELLQHKQTICEQPFHSDAPFIGPLIVWFRTRWNNIAARWYVLPMVQQQNEFNALLVNAIEQCMSVFQMQIDDLEARLIALDHDQVNLAQHIAEMRYQLILMRKGLTGIEGMAECCNNDAEQALN